MVRSGNAANESGPTFILCQGQEANPAFTDVYLQQHGAAPFSKVVMTPSAYMTDETWKFIVPPLTDGWRLIIRQAAAKYGIPAEKADQLIVALFLDGFKAHTKNLLELIKMAKQNMIACVENRDSSAINQAFDKFVARAGKRRAAKILDIIRRSHVYPIIDQWTLVVVALDMLRDCSASKVWENSFIAVNMHPHYRLPLHDWLAKIRPFTMAADKFEEEHIEELTLLPPAWTDKPVDKRDEWIKIIDDDGASWDIDLIQKLRDADLPLDLVANIFKIYTVVKRADNQRSDAEAAAPAAAAYSTPTL